MTRDDEAKALVAVINHLAERFPDLPRPAIETVVAEELGNLNGGPIRDYVPLLVEHAARNRLTKEAREIQASVGLSTALAGKQPRVDIR
ncbi:three-helix bundle dimerization domain-containing protein [Arthrobacter sp. KNU40]|uniref:three-helix bundle dimerization domain-containing protein n=1 Tax=Arthrobacter sp. KNU40 TaxID=3447965 RepID=UPI003F600C04